MTRTVQEIMQRVRISYEGMNFLDEDAARDIIHELWGEGWTFTRRSQDPFEIAGLKPPPGMAYQWMPREAVHVPRRLVPYERHDGCFAPIGTKGDVEVGGLVLAEQCQHYVAAEHQKRIAGAQKNVDDWMDKYGGQFSGHVSVAQGGTMVTREVGAASGANALGNVNGVSGVTREVPNATRFPPDMYEHAREVFEERDRLVREYWDTRDIESKSAGPDMAAVTAQAIQNVRAELAKAAETFVSPLTEPYAVFKKDPTP